MGQLKAMSQTSSTIRLLRAMAVNIVVITAVSAVLSIMITATIIYLSGRLDIMPLGLSIAVACCVLVTPPVTFLFQKQALLLEEAHVQLQEIHGELAGAHKQLSRLHDKLHDAYREMERRASRDGMTGLANREAFFRALSAMPRKLDRGYVLMIDADRFKRINDEYGHDAGDRVIRAIAEAISRSIRADDVGARIGGEEFAVILRDAELDEANLVAERIRMQVEGQRTGTAEGRQLGVTVSIGGAPVDMRSTQEQVMSLADKQLYKAKNSGRNMVCITSEAARAA